MSYQQTSWSDLISSIIHHPIVARKNENEISSRCDPYEIHELCEGKRSKT